MTTNQHPTKTPEEIAAAFAAVFGSMTPAESRGSMLKQQLALYRKEIEKQRRRGLSWRQIAIGLRDPRIGVKVCSKTLAQIAGERPQSAARKSSAEPRPQRIMLDPVTGKIVVVPRPGEQSVQQPSLPGPSVR